MGLARHEMRDVELVEVDADVPALRADGGEAPGPDPARPGPRGRRPPPRWTAAAAVAVLAVGGTVGTVVSDSRERARMARLAGVTGVVQPLAGPVVERWRAEMPLWIDLTEVGGMLVGVTDARGGDRDVDVVALDAGTGETVWRTSAAPAERLPLGGVRCSVPDAAEGAAEQDRLVVCLVVEVLGPSAYDRSQFEPQRTRMLVLEVATGEVVVDRSVDPTTSVAPIGPDVVVKDRGPGGRVRVTRTDPLGEQERWTFTGPATRGPQEYTPVRVDGDLVLVPGEEGWVLSADGDVVDSWEPQVPSSAGWAEVLGGRTLIRPVRDALGATRVRDLPTGREFSADAYPLTTVTDDGSAGDLTLMQSSTGKGLLAFDRSGDVRWTVDGPDAGGLVVLDGRAIRVEFEEMQAVDTRTGEVVWRTPVPRASQYGLLTDGRVVLRAEPDPENDLALVARRLDDGRVEWSADVPDDVRHVFTVGGRLYGYSTEGLVALGVPDDVPARTGA